MKEISLQKTLESKKNLFLFKLFSLDLRCSYIGWTPKKGNKEI